MDVFTVDDLELIKKLIKELVNKNEIKAIRMLLKNNPHCSQLIPRELNKEIKISKYKFSSRGGRLILIVNKMDTVNDRCVKLLNNVINELK